MTAYVIVDLEVTDPEGYKEYVKLAPAAVKLYGGKYIARGGAHETLEGDWHARRLVILEFPSAEQAKTWLNSPEYALARALRHKYAKTNMVWWKGREQGTGPAHRQARPGGSTCQLRAGVGSRYAR